MILNDFIFTYWFWMKIYLIDYNQIEKVWIFYGIWDIWFDNRINENNILTNIIFQQNWDINYPNERMHMGTSSDLKFHFYGMLFTFTKCTFKTITLKKVSILYWKCLAKKYWIQIKLSRCLKKVSKKSFMLSFGNTSPLTSAIIKNSLFHSKSTQLSVIKIVEIPSCLTIAKTSCRTFILVYL